MDALPAALVEKIKARSVNLDDPATTLALIKLKAVLGVVGTFDAAGKMTKVGLTCAVCHSTVDDAFSAGIGHRLDGFGNRDLNPGAIIAATPNVSLVAKTLDVDLATVKKVLASWGPGRFDAILDKDGKGMRPDGKQAGTVIPNAFGLAGVNNHTWGGGWGDVTYWNAYVANTELHGKGTFHDVRLSDKTKYRGERPNRQLEPPQHAGSDHIEVGGAPGLPAFDPGAASASRVVRCGCGTAWRGIVCRQGTLRNVSCSAALHRARVEHAQAERHRHRRFPGEQNAGWHVSHGATQGPLDI